MSVTAKRCPMCGRVLPIAEFPPNRTRKDGRYEYCRPCKRDYDRAYMMARRANAHAERLRGEGEES